MAQETFGGVSQEREQFYLFLMILKNVVRKVDDRYGWAGASGSPQEGAPGRAARSPAIAAVLILFAQNRKGVPTAAKTEWPSTRILSRIDAQGWKPERKDKRLCGVRLPDNGVHQCE